MGRKGFTAVELIVSLLIISVLMMGVMPTVGVFKNIRDVKAEMLEAEDEIAVKIGVPVYQILYGRLPESLDELISSGIVTGESNKKLDYIDGEPVLVE